MRLKLGHRLDQRLGAAAIADAPAGHAIGLRDAIHGQAAIAQPRLDLHRGGEAEAVIDEVLVQSSHSSQTCGWFISTSVSCLSSAAE